MDNNTEQNLLVDHDDLPPYLYGISQGNISDDDDIDDDRSGDGSHGIPALEPIPDALDELDEEIEQGAFPQSQAPLPTASNRESQPTTQTVDEEDDDDDDDDEMPELHSISSSSDEEDSDEVEMMQDLQPIDDDNDSSWTDSGTNLDDLDMPPLEPIEPAASPSRNNRRARVDDDEDADRDRRHPSQRVAGTTDSNNVNQRPVPPATAIPFQIRIPAIVRIVSTPRTNVGPDAQRRQHNPTAPNPGAPQHPHANNNVPRPHPHAMPIFRGGFTVTLGAGPFPGQAPGARNQPPGQGIPRPPGGFAEAIDLNMFADFMERFGAGLGQALGLEREEQEDPERAKKLVAGLEEVPYGLVRRLEQVGGAPGSHVDESSEIPGCAICWDKLLDAEGDGFSKKEAEPEAAPAPGDEPSVQSPESSTTTSPQSQEESTSTASPTNYPAIVSLPCAHVFHASCLLPWFSRPRQTTCPTCRFNIDPENLTYVRRPPPPPQTNATNANATSAQQPAPQQAPNVNPGSNPMTPPTAPVAQQESVAETAPPVEAVPTSMPEEPVPQAPTPTAPTEGPPPAPGSTPPPIPPPPPPPNANAGNLPRDGDFWTFGFDFVFEDPNGPLPAGAQGPAQGAPAEQDTDDMDIDEIDMEEEAGEMRREAEAFAQRVFGGMGLNMADVPPEFVPVAPNTANATPPTAGEAGAPQPPPHEAAEMQREAEAFAQRVLGGMGLNLDDLPPPLVPVPNAANTAPPAAGQAGAPQPPPPHAGPAGAQPNVRTFPPGFVPIPPQWIPGNPFVATPAGAPGNPAGNAPFNHWPPFVPFAQGHAPTMFPRAAGPPRERKAWSLPPAPGPTLRQHVEQKEREAGMRCFDTSCGIGPSDEEPCVDKSTTSMKQLRIRHCMKDATSMVDNTSTCAHTFHPACLVSAERVAMMGTEEHVAGREVELSCPVCRAAGCITTEEWREGELALA